MTVVITKDMPMTYLLFSIKSRAKQLARPIPRLSSLLLAPVQPRHYCFTLAHAGLRGGRNKQDIALCEARAEVLVKSRIVALFSLKSDMRERP
ncbi:hypothetical protein J6590_005581 [Homalodisca vitripennis]|nr:hypothetical protein J6590_005581 [Homalodisca vitripennis]